jgi:hypothetical protein
MKLSGAIREGAKKRPQAFFVGSPFEYIEMLSIPRGHQQVLGSSALGAALEGYGYRDSDEALADLGTDDVTHLLTGHYGAPYNIIIGVPVGVPKDLRGWVSEFTNDLEPVPKHWQDELALVHGQGSPYGQAMGLHPAISPAPGSNRSPSGR